ncbi:MAG: hypothetical protein GX897_03810 [Clostridiales bacterium]|nr:hypothetical protein [Clostridiales bacterium]
MPSKKVRFDSAYLRDAGIYIITALLSIALIVYIILAAVGTFDTGIETIAATVTTENRLVSFDAYIMRSEEPVVSIARGGINYAVSDGDVIAVGDKLADIYVGGSETQRMKTIALEKQISVLENSNVSGNQLMSNTSALDDSIDSLYTDIYAHINSGDIGYAVRRRNDLLINLNRREIILRKRADYNTEIESLRRQKEIIATPAMQAGEDGLFAGSAGADETVFSPYAGYFYTELDGYENIFSADRIPTLTVGEFNEMVKSEPESGAYVQEQGWTIGKIMTKYVWYIACKADRDLLMSFRDGYKYTVVFPYSNDTRVKMTLYRIITETDSDEVVLVFRGGDLPKDFNFLRRQTVEIVETSYTGYKVPVSAVRIVNISQDEEGRRLVTPSSAGESGSGEPGGRMAQGVYILDGDRVHFREIKALAQINGYVICAEQNPAQDADYRYKLGLYDRVIVKGKNLSDGKIVN